MASIRDGENELSILGRKTEYRQDYAPEVLEAFTNKHQEGDYWVRFHCPEFTSLCPITAQPDYATIYINYIPDVRMVESKSLKLYLFSFRNHGAFHEDCVNIIMKDLIESSGTSPHAVVSASCPSPTMGAPARSTRSSPSSA